MEIAERASVEDHKLFEHMDSDEEVRSGAPTAGSIASGRGDDGRPLHRGWPPAGGRRRWLEPFVLALLAEGPAHGYSIIGRLGETGVTEGNVDVGQVYKTLRDLETAGQVVSKWELEPSGPPRRGYLLTDAGWAALDEWRAVMDERKRLIEDFEARAGRSSGPT
jgi:PadR family transcriptional regulator, regulatory protein PadR